jgi:hypothetical protein
MFLQRFSEERRIRNQGMPRWLPSKEERTRQFAEAKKRSKLARVSPRVTHTAAKQLRV